MWVTDGLHFAATEKSDYIHAIGLSSAKFQHREASLGGRIHEIDNNEASRSQRTFS